MTKELDRRFRHVGRIKRSWGTTHKATIRQMENMLDGLFQRGRLDILKLIQDKTYTPLEVYDAWRVGELERLPTAATLAPLKESMTKWIEKKECSEAHRLSLQQSLRHLLSRGSAATTARLPTLLGNLRDYMQGKHPRSFNLARAAAQAFAKTTAGRNSKLWQDITAIEVLRVTPQRRKHPLTPDELFAITREMPGTYAGMVETMALTGMGPGEYWGKWEVRRDRVHVFGTKRMGRDRDVPLVHRLSPPIGTYKGLRKALEGKHVRPYDLRRTFANWMEAAGIPRARRRAYMGHGAKDVTDLYERHEVEAYLRDDALKLRAYVFGAREKQALKLEKA